MLAAAAHASSAHPVVKALALRPQDYHSDASIEH